MLTKVDKCRNCCPDGGACYTSDTMFREDGKLHPVWVCNNCHRVTPRKVCRPDISKITPSQEKAIVNAMGALAGTIGYNWNRPDRHAVVRVTHCEMLDYTGRVYLAIRTDEDCALIRTHCYLTIGRQGSISGKRCTFTNEFKVERLSDIYH